MNLVLIGMPGCGKSTVGALAAKQLNMDFVDTDALVVKQEGRSISEIFATDGEEYFRKIEASVILEIARDCGSPGRSPVQAPAAMTPSGGSMTPSAIDTPRHFWLDPQSSQTGIVVSLGGGAPMYATNVDIMRKIGEIILVDRPLSLIENNVTYDNDRPLLTNVEKLHELFDTRMPIYREIANHLIVNDADVERVVNSLVVHAQIKNSQANFLVIGDPIGHSLSSVLHNIIYGMLDIDARYAAVRVRSNSLDSAIHELLIGNICGMNVTIPHKQAIIPYLDEIKGDAQTGGAVNTVVACNGNLIGYNTDMEGLKLALASKGITYKGKNLVVLGSGGAAAGIAQKALAEGASSVTLVSRNAKEKIITCRDSRLRGNDTLSMDSGTASGMTYVSLDLSLRAPRGNPAFDTSLASTDILINATPLGMHGSGKEFTDFDFLDKLKVGAFVCDLVYNPAETALLREAKSRGFECMNGLPMLIYQGILSDELFFDGEISAKISIERENLFAAVFESLSNAL